MTKFNFSTISASLIVFLCLLTACQKGDDCLTDAEVLGKQLSKEFEKKRVGLVDATSKSTSTFSTGDFEFEGAFIKVRNVYFNLEKLAHYNIGSYQFPDGTYKAYMYFE